MWLTIEPNDSDAVLHVADQCVNERIQLSIIRQVTGSGPARFHANSQRQRLPIRVWIERKMLRYTVVGQNKVVRRELKDHFSRLGLHQRRHLHQGRAHAQSRLACIALLRGSACRGEGQQKRQDQPGSHNRFIVGAVLLAWNENQVTPSSAHDEVQCVLFTKFSLTVPAHLFSLGLLQNSL